MEVEELERMASVWVSGCFPIGEVREAAFKSYLAGACNFQDYLWNEANQYKPEKGKPVLAWLGNDRYEILTWTGEFWNRNDMIMAEIQNGGSIQYGMNRNYTDVLYWRELDIPGASQEMSKRIAYIRSDLKHDKDIQRLGSE